MLDKTPIAIALFAATAAMAAPSGPGAPRNGSGQVVMLNVTRPAVVQTYAVAAGSGHLPEGHVTVNFCVTPEGRTAQAKVLRSAPGRMFDSAALQLVRAAQFKPHEENGVPVTACGITQTIVFKPAPRSG